MPHENQNEQFLISLSKAAEKLCEAAGELEVYSRLNWTANKRAANRLWQLATSFRCHAKSLEHEAENE